jgi:dephospho-CoA kinase
MMLVLGLTGSIGMGKSVTASLFAAEGAPVHSADAAVHRLYAGEGAAAVEQAFPGVMADGRIDREKLAQRVLGDREAMARLESIVHPLVRAAEAEFLAAARAAGARIAVLDIPLLLETGSEKRVDAVVVVTAPGAVQRARVLERPGMTAEKLDAILAKQMPDAQKRRRAHFLVDSARGIDSARTQIRGILRAVAAIPGQ